MTSHVTGLVTFRTVRSPISLNVTRAGLRQRRWQTARLFGTKTAVRILIICKHVAAQEIVALDRSLTSVPMLTTNWLSEDTMRAIRFDDQSFR